MQALQALEQVGQLALAPQRQDTLAEDAENPLYQRRPLIPIPPPAPPPGPAPPPAPPADRSVSLRLAAALPPDSRPGEAAESTEHAAPGSVLPSGSPCTAFYAPVRDHHQAAAL